MIVAPSPTREHNPLPKLVVTTVEITNPGQLLALLPPEQNFAWLRQGEGMVAWGEAARINTSGNNRFLDASAWWRQLCEQAEITDEVRMPGSGLICFGSFAFADTSGDSTLVVPNVIVGRRGDTSWLTTINHPAVTPTAATPPQKPAPFSFHDGALTGPQWQEVVAEAVTRINAGELDKVVLARDVIASSSTEIDIRWPLQQLAHDYPMCWVFHVAGMFGATPEMLIRKNKGLVTSRVLAGTIRPNGDDDRALAMALTSSSKDMEEHEYAVNSVADALEPFCDSVHRPEAPFALRLPNVMHLATDVSASVHGAASVLDLAEALHPSAAVGGTPTKKAVELIAEIEGLDRGRYAAPVGWMDAAGDGEFGIALRAAEHLGNQVRLFAGCGIVADSDPVAELAESNAKLVPVKDALTN